MELSFQLSKKDFREYIRESFKIYYSNSEMKYVLPILNFLIYLPVGLFIYAIIELKQTTFGREEELASVALYGLLFFFAIRILLHVYRSKRWVSLAIENNGRFLAPSTMKIARDGISMKSDTHKFDLEWSAVLRTKETGNLLLLFFDSADAVVIPKRAFGDADAQRQAIEEINLYMPQSS